MQYLGRPRILIAALCCSCEELEKLWYPSTFKAIVCKSFSFRHIFVRICYLCFWWLSSSQVRDDMSLQFWFLFPWYLVILSTFSCTCGPSVCLLWKNVCLVLWPIFLIGSFIFLELSCRSYLYIFEISCLSAASFAIIFSHSEGFLFTYLTVFFVVQKLINLRRSHLFIFVFISITLGGGSKRILLWFMSESVLSNTWPWLC